MKVGYQILADLQQQQAFKQWGYYVESQNPTDYRYWSIPFTSHYITMATKTYYEPKEEAVPWLVGIDMQKFICGYGANFIGSSYVSCVGIGCQPQWGINTGGAVRTSTLPIPFTNVFLAVASTSSEWCCPGCSATNTTVTTRAYQSNRPDVAQPNDVNWIIIGCQPQWGNGSSSSFSKKDYATPKDIGTVTISTPISMSTLYQGFICASSTSGPSLFVGFVTAYSGNSLTVRLITSLDSGSGGSLVPNYILLGH